MRIPELTKRPDEIYSIGFKYVSPDLEEGLELLSCVVTITPTESGGLQVMGSPVIEPDIVSQVVSGGVDGHEYYVKFLTTTSGGHTYEDAIFVRCRVIE